MYKNKKTNKQTREQLSIHTADIIQKSLLVNSENLNVTYVIKDYLSKK